VWQDIDTLYRLKSRALRIGFCGAGGKTTSLVCLSKLLLNMHQKVLITTTTKMFPLPESDELGIVIRETFNPNDFNSKSICQWFGGINEEGKGVGPKADEIEKMNNYANIWKLIEIDGSRMHPIKAPSYLEPVYTDGLDLVYGVIGASAFGQPISEQWVHRLERFLEVTQTKQGQMITPEVVSSLIQSPQGLFKDLPEGTLPRVLFSQVKPEHEVFIESVKEKIQRPIEVLAWFNK
jgi:probable selenium-dependent hydroxylase accessory protein YqeC